MFIITFEGGASTGCAEKYSLLYWAHREELGVGCSVCAHPSHADRYLWALSPLIVTNTAAEFVASWHKSCWWRLGGIMIRIRS